MSKLQTETNMLKFKDSIPQILLNKHNPLIYVDTLYINVWRSGTVSDKINKEMTLLYNRVTPDIDLQILSQRISTSKGRNERQDRSDVSDLQNLIFKLSRL